MKHEDFVSAVRDIAVRRLPATAGRERLLGAKLVYGSGSRGTRGTCFHGAWQNGAAHDFLEISAAGEQSAVQLAGTTLHELAHCLAGAEAGHGVAWKRAAACLGLVDAMAAGEEYDAESFAPDVWAEIQTLPDPSDGAPAFDRVVHRGFRFVTRPGACQAGAGSRGGRSRGPRSGSRLRLWVCECRPPVHARVASDTFAALCLTCQSPFERGVAP
ncbi:MAG: hypothetical protein HY727_21655 [Candidatus Rokubacteria bacterium]|nr:hypothetical protein [Candidatus Rokubacteria bacterium]